MASVRVLWNEQEVAILLDYYAQYNAGEITQKEAVKNASKELRERVRKNSIAIDNVFRNENGIAMQMSKIEDLFIGRKGRLSKAPKVFEDIVDKYHNDKTAFDRMLWEAREVEGGNLSSQKDFFKWMTDSGKISTIELSRLRFIYSEIESFCISRKVLKKPLFETNDIAEVTAVKSIVDSNKIFRFTYKKKIGKMQKAMKYYYGYIKEKSQSVPVIEPIIRNSQTIKENDFNKEKGEFLVVIFGTGESYAFTHPISFLYFRNEYHVKNWTQLYVKLVGCLYEDYPQQIKNLMSSRIGGKGRIYISDSSSTGQMAAPREFADGLFLETNFSANDITLKIKQLLDLCGVDYENVIILYTTSKLENTQKNMADFDNARLISMTSIKVASFSNNKTFLRWMGDKQNMALTSARSYASGINIYEQMAVKFGLESTKLYGVSYAEAQKTANALMQTNEYQNANNSQQNRLKASLSTYLQYLSGGNDVSLHQPSKINMEESKIDLKPYEVILQENFPKGYRAESTLDLKRFIRYYNNTYGTEFDVGDDEVRSNTRERILQIGVRHEDYIFAVNSLVKPETRGRLLSHIKGVFLQGKRVIYYKVLFEKFNEEFLCQRIYDEDMLRTYLLHECGNHYIFERRFMSREKNVQVDLKNEISNLLISYGAPMKTEKLYERLSHFPAERIDGAIHTNKEFICNTWREYFHVSLIDFSSDELEEIAEIIQQTIDKSNFISGNELVNAICIKYPSMMERFPQFSLIGIRGAIAYYMDDKFSFNGNIISPLQKQLSMSEVFAEFAKTHHSFTIDELNVLKNEINSTIYFDSIYANSLRVSQRWFVSKDRADFNVPEIDKAISAFCTESYIPLAEVTSFGSFPYNYFPWSIYLLEHYVSSYSAKYKLIHTSFNADNCVGAIVEKNSDINNLNDLLTDVLVHSDIELNKKEALQYLCDKRYLARRKLSNIDQILIEARAKRG